MRILLITVLLFGMWACSATPEEAAKQACDCKRAELEIKLAADDAAKVKLTELAQKCKKKFNEKFSDIKSDKEFYDAYTKELNKCYKQLEKEFGVEIK
jgi:hypothetical protein